MDLSKFLIVTYTNSNIVGVLKAVQNKNIYCIKKVNGKIIISILILKNGDEKSHRCVRMCDIDVCVCVLVIPTSSIYADNHIFPFYNKFKQRRKKNIVNCCFYDAYACHYPVSQSGETIISYCVVEQKLLIRI